jgi:hypothetical protein
MAHCQAVDNLPSSGMRCLSCVLVCCGLAGCLPLRSVAPVSDPAVPPAQAAAVPKAVVAITSPDLQPATAICAPQVTSCKVAGIMLEGVAFDSRRYRLSVADQPGGPGSRWPDATAAALAHHALAAVNAGFFTPQGMPLGRVVVAGVPVGTWNHASSIGSGVWLEAANGMPAIMRREAVPVAMAARELIQAGPMLVENHHPVAGLETTKSSVRSLLMWDGGTRWWLGRAAPCTLAALGQALASGTPAGWPVAHALNLDGGRSSDLAIGAAVTGGPLTRRAPWNVPVRNFLVLAPRGR